MTYTWNSDTAAHWLRASRLIGLPVGQSVDVGLLLARLCDLVERRLPPELPDEIEVTPHREKRDLGGSLTTTFAAEEVPYYEVRVRLAGIGYAFQAVRPEPETAGRFAVAMAMLGDRPTLRAALENARDVLRHEANHGPATDVETVRARREALDAADRALESP